MTAATNTSVGQQADLNPLRLKHNSYNFTDAGVSQQTAYEVADTLEDYFAPARLDKLSESQVNELTKFVDDEHVFRVAVMAIPEVARLAGQDYWVQGKDDGKRSAQVIHILHAIAHREPRSRRLSRPAEDIVQMRDQRAELLTQAKQGADTENADAEATEDMEEDGSADAAPSTKMQTEEVTTVGELIRSRQDAGRASWRQRHGGT